MGVSRIAIVGSGQLARMMALDGIPMGLSFSFLAEVGEDTRCVDWLGDVVVREDNMTAAALYEALGRPDVVTVEKEHVDIVLLESLQTHCPVHPLPSAVEKFKNRRVEKRFLESLDIPIAPFHEVRTRDDLEKALGELSKPIFLKTEEEGYDGYNQYKITEDTAASVLEEINFPGAWVAESFVPFEREVSFLAARSKEGEIVYYPPVENDHHKGTLLASVAPAPNMSDAQIATGQKYVKDIVEALDYVGLICLECFIVGQTIMVNEIAPRVHNSGHWTSKGAATSQFENHVRAVSGLPLGSTQTYGVSGMLNLLGVTLTAEQASAENAYLALYGKTVRPRRKLGHVTILSESVDEAKKQLNALEVMAYGNLDKDSRVD